MEVNNPEKNQDVEVVDTTNTEIVPLDKEQALAHMSEEDRKEVLALADQIDVMQLENVMNYGSNALSKNFEQSGSYLKSERGSEADQRVIKQVIELSKKASKSYEDFNLVLKEPNFFQKMWLKVSSKQRASRSDKIQKSAISNYKLLTELGKSYDEWIEMLRKAFADAASLVGTDFETLALQEKYITAGKIAQERIAGELEELRVKSETSGLIEDQQKYKAYKRGAETFDIAISNLEKSRATTKISIAELMVIGDTNTKLQITNLTQKVHSMTLIAQQLRNGVLNAKNQEALEGQQAITRLNDELLKGVSDSIGTTAVDSQKLMYSGFYSAQAARDAVQKIIATCEEINRTAEEMIPKMKAETEEINRIIDEDLEKKMTGVAGTEQFDSVKGKTLSDPKPKRKNSKTSSSELKF